MDKKPSTRQEAVPWIISQLSEDRKAEIFAMELQGFFT